MTTRPSTSVESGPAGDESRLFAKDARPRKLTIAVLLDYLKCVTYVKLTVSDDGCGMPPQDLGRAFEPFFTKKRAGESSGSGLGLAIVHGVVKEHGGFIDVTSTLHVGTTFAVYFPSVQETPEGRAQLQASPRGHSRILVVDDEPAQLRTCRRVLVRLGYQVEILDSGLRAYDLFNQAVQSGKSPFDLVIIDMLLNEELDGLHIFERSNGYSRSRRPL